MDFAIKSCAPGIHPDKDLDFKNCLASSSGDEKSFCLLLAMAGASELPADTMEGVEHDPVSRNTKRRLSASLISMAAEHAAHYEFVNETSFIDSRTTAIAQQKKLQQLDQRVSNIETTQFSHQIEFSPYKIPFGQFWDHMAALEKGEVIQTLSPTRLWPHA